MGSDLSFYVRKLINFLKMLLEGVVFVGALLVLSVLIMLLGSL